MKVRAAVATLLPWPYVCVARAVFQQQGDPPRSLSIEILSLKAGLAMVFGPAAEACPIHMSATDRSNEGKACDAVLRDIEARIRAPRRELVFPEKTHSVGPVELVCTVGTQRFAFEHTRIEPFAGHIQLEAEAKRHFQPITERVKNQLPAETRFELVVPAGAMLGLNDRAARPIQDALVRWILATAPGLPTAQPGRYILPIQRVTPPGVPFVVSLHCWPRDGFPFPFVIQHLVDGDVESARLPRIRKAYNRKVPKLLQWKTAGARTILILEEDDIFLTNHFNVVDALALVDLDAHENEPTRAQSSGPTECAGMIRCACGSSDASCNALQI